MRAAGWPEGEHTAQVGFAAFALGVAFGLKQFYSRAGFDDLQWVLSPTVWLVERLTGAEFNTEPHHGYLSRDLRYEIVPSCAGVNFMIVVFCSLVCGLLHTRRTLGAQALWVAASGCIAYGTTLLANAARVALAVRLHDAQVSWGALTPARLHEVEGAAVYFLFLCVIFAIAARMTGARRDIAI